MRFLKLKRNCFFFPVEYILCNTTGRCVPESWKCDGDPDCGVGDNSDEPPECGQFETALFISDCNVLKRKGPFTPRVSDNSAMRLVIPFLLKTMESLENGLQPQSGLTPLFSMRTESPVSWQSCPSIDGDGWYKRALKHV